MRLPSKPTCSGSRACARSFEPLRAATGPRTSGCAPTNRSRVPSGASSQGALTEMGSWSLLAPAGLGLLGLLAPLIVLYILKIKRQRLRVASTWLWAVAQRDLMARTPFKKLIAQIPLL